MYLDHFGLERPPFRITPDPRLFFSGGTRGSVLDALVYAITTGEGIIKVVGEVGSGKTMLCRMLENRLPANVEIVYIANPNLSPDDILRAVAFEANLSARAPDRLTIMQCLQRWLLERHARGRRVVVFIEEAQGMPLATLEEIRLLSNLETGRSKLLQIVMFGQPELDTKLAASAIRQMRERISHSFFLTPFNVHDVQAYLNSRMRSAGYRGPEPFRRSSARLARRYSHGLLRRLNIIADKALLAAYADGCGRIRGSHIRRAARDSAFGASAYRSAGNVLATFILFFCAALAIGHSFKHPSPLLVSRADATVPQAVASREQSTPAAGNDSVANVIAPEELSLLQLSAASPAAGMKRHNHEHTVRAWLAAARNWVYVTPRTSFSIQLLTVARSESEWLQRRLRSFGGLLDLDKIYIYESGIGGRRMLSVMYSEFATRSEALAVMHSLPQVLRANRPFLRTVGDVRGKIFG